MKKIAIILGAIVLCLSAASGQGIERVEPLCWWEGMRNTLQLMIYGEDISGSDVKVCPEGITVTAVHNADSPNYLFVDVDVAEAGIYTFTLSREDTRLSFDYEIHHRREGSGERPGFSPADAIYLVMPDRFANGDPTNDVLYGSADRPDRRNPTARHGGDIQGITDHLDYIADLGATAIWLTPVLEDNLSYHQYGCTDYYRIDPHMGTNELYRQMVGEAHNRGVKVIMDVVSNHCGIGHWWMEDLPFADWINYPDSRQVTNLALNSFSDPYASESDRELCARGWFVDTMPDMNLSNPFTFRYLAQAAIWWTEYADLDGLRVDTYFYMGREASQWTNTIRKEYPFMNIAGEIWGNDPPVIAYWLGGTSNHDGFETDLPSAMDFPLQRSLITGLASDNEGWGGTTKAIYNTLALDFLYDDPNSRLVVFADNHDTERLYNMLGKDVDKVKLALTFIATTRGTPQITYGTELLFGSDPSGGAHRMRPDFPGGWAGDSLNLFEREGRDDAQNEVFEHLRTLLNFRKNTPALHAGELKHFYPTDNLYVYFRRDADESVMVMLNASDEQREIVWERFCECLEGHKTGFDVLNGRKVTAGEKTIVEPKSSIVIHFK